MNTCATCRYYQPPVPWYTGTEHEGFGRCGQADSDNGTRCDPETLAFAMDADGYRAWLHVRPEFGCVLWEAKENPTDGTTR